jgi:hypothetical protein
MSLLLDLMASCLFGAAVATFLCKFPDWLAARQFESLGGPVEIVEPKAEPAETVCVGGVSFRLGDSAGGGKPCGSSSTSRSDCPASLAGTIRP